MPLPLPTLLSQALVAYTIEFDNAFEARFAHRTALSKRAGEKPKGPWLVSLVMWSNFLRFIDEDAGVPVAEFRRSARLTPAGARTWLTRLSQWGYARVGPDDVVRFTAAGRKARAAWIPLLGEIEARWRARFGADSIERLRAALTALVEELDANLPEYMPIVGYGLFTTFESAKAPGFAAPPRSQLVAPSYLPGLLSKVLLAFTLDFERDYAVSLAISANVLRVLDAAGVAVRDLPRLAGVSKEGVAMALGFLDKRGLATGGLDASAPRTKLARLTPEGLTMKRDAERRIADLEAEWRERFGSARIEALRAALEPLVSGGGDAQSPVFAGLETPPGGWRATQPRPATLPHHPMVLHRGGYPDGA